MKLILIGHGKMGKLLEQTATERGDEVVAALNSANLDQLSALPAADMAIDFSRPEALDAVCAYVRRTGTPLLSGTTGYTAEQMNKLRALGAYAPVLYAANYSLGIAVFERMLSQISDTLKPEFDIEIEETHHNQKADAPSGTAKLLLHAIDPDGAYTPVYGREGSTGKRTKKEIGIHALRGGTVAGTVWVPATVPPRRAARLPEPIRFTFSGWTKNWRSRTGPAAAKSSSAAHSMRRICWQIDPRAA